jgi:type I restriction enzyme S subunit
MKYRLGDICTITKGATGIMKAIPGPYTMIALGETDKTHIEYQFDTKAVIIPLVSSTGHGHASMKRVKYCEGKFALGNILCAVIPNDESFVLAKYLHIYLHWNREELLVSQMKGMANVSLPMNKIADVMVTVPSIDKQREIIELEKQLVEKELKADSLFADQLTQLENLNQAILQEAVQGKLVAQDPKDEPASELLKRIKAEKAALRQAQGKGKKEKPLPPIKPDEIPFEIPENWVWCRLGEVIQLISGQDLKPSEYNAKNIGIPYITGASHFNDGILEISRWTPFPKSKSNLGDLLITCKGTIGAMAFNEIGEIHIARQIMAIRNSYGIDISFVKYFLSQHIERLLELSKSLIPGISRDNILSIKFPLPPLSEQKRIVAEIEKQFALTKQLKEHIIANQQATEQLLKALLHQAFEVEEMVIAKPKGKVIELKPTNVDYYRRTVLAAEIVWQLHKEPTLGHLKLQKLIYLCQKSADMQLPTNFLRQAMGPYDNRLMRSIDKQLKEKKWFEYKQDQILKYQPLEKAGQHHNDFLKYFSAESEGIQFIIDKFRNVLSREIEIWATLYACMDNMLNENVIFSEASLLQRFYEWSEEKKKFSEDQIKRVFSRMKETGIIPKGFNL